MGWPWCQLLDEVLAVVEGDRADRGRACRDGHPGVARALPGDRVRGHLEGPLRARGVDLVGRPVRPGGPPVNGWFQIGGVDQVAPDIVAVGVTEAADGVVGGALGPDPQVAHAQLVLARDGRLAQGVRGARAGRDVACHVGQVRGRREGVEHVDQPDPDGLVEARAGHLAIDLVALLEAVELTPEQPLARACPAPRSRTARTPARASRACCPATARSWS